MRTIILFLGVTYLLFLTGGFSTIGGGDIFKVLVQNFDFMTVINAIPIPVWIVTIILDIVKK